MAEAWGREDERHFISFKLNKPDNNSPKPLKGIYIAFVCDSERIAINDIFRIRRIQMFIDIVLIQ